ncbi:MAG: hypothetical protein JKY51_09100, partial [Opitutaceae bacterium]|nr:hypothetical protein [Opitutaceae bacterium]
IHQNAIIYASLLEKGRELFYVFPSGRRGWLQLISGSVSVNKVLLEEGDAAVMEEEREVKITALEDAEFLFFDLA